MLNSFTANPHGLRIFIEPLLHRFDNMLVLPSRNAALFARGAFGLALFRRSVVRPC
jgi:flavorubredoxin